VSFVSTKHEPAENSNEFSGRAQACDVHEQQAEKLLDPSGHSWVRELEKRGRMRAEYRSFIVLLDSRRYHHVGAQRCKSNWLGWGKGGSERGGGCGDRTAGWLREPEKKGGDPLASFYVLPQTGENI